MLHGSTVDVRTWGETSEKNKYVFPLGSKPHRETFSDLSEDDRTKFSGAKYGASQWNVHGIESVTASGHCRITIATPADLSSDAAWTLTGGTFSVSGTTYKLYSAFYTAAMASAGTPLAIPHHSEWSTIVFASGGNLTVDAPEPPCTIIDYATTLRGTTVNNPAISILSDGSYLASQTASVNKGYVYRSTDRGASWKQISSGLRQTYCALYEQGSTLYMMGCDKVGGNIAVQKSTDGGVTWSANSIILTGTGTGYHGSSSPFVTKDGRVYRAMGVRGGTASDPYPVGVLLLSAPADADLSDASVWTVSNTVNWNSSWLGVSARGWQEPALVKRADGSLCIIMRIDGTSAGEYAGLVEVHSDTSISFSRTFAMPGAAKRLTIAYDSLSGKYWSLVSPFYSNTRSLYGLSPVQNRNSLVLVSSPDLVNWTRERTCIYSDNAYNNSYHYIDWRFDGSDLVSVFRLSVDEERGLPLNYHDSNAFGYFRVSDFRNGGAVATIFVDTPVVDGTPAIPSL